MKVFIIAEIAQAHDGSLGILHSYIDALKDSGIDAIKFQCHIAAAESSEYEEFRVKFSYADKTRFDYWKRMELSLVQWQEVKKHCEDNSLEFLCTPSSCAAVEMLEALKVKKYKISSADVNNFLLLEKVAKIKKEMILSSGMSDFEELDSAVNLLKKQDSKFSILQCTSKYPTLPEDVGLNLIAELKTRYNLPIGLSDHSGTIYPSLAAVALGAEIIEVHTTFDKRMFGPDATSSLTIDEIKNMAGGIRFIEKSLKNKVDKNKNMPDLKKIKTIFEKSLAVNKNLKEGHVLAFEDLESKKPFGHGIPAADYKKVIGKKINKNLSQWSFLKETDIK